MAAPMGVSLSAFEPGRLEGAADSKSVTTRTGPKPTQATSTRLAASSSCCELVAEGLEARVELVDGRPGHRRRGVEQQHTGAPRLGVLGKVVGSERHLLRHRSLLTLVCRAIVSSRTPPCGPSGPRARAPTRPGPSASTSTSWPSPRPGVVVSGVFRSVSSHSSALRDAPPCRATVSVAQRRSRRKAGRVRSAISSQVAGWPVSSNPRNAPVGHDEHAHLARAAASGSGRARGPGGPSPR